MNIPTKENFIEYKNNHTIKETAKHFNLNRYAIEKLLNKFEIIKHHAIQIKNCPKYLNEEQKEVLIGNLLGDGHLAKLTQKSKNSLFEIKQKLDKSEYIKNLFEIYKPFSKKYSEGQRIKPIKIDGKIHHNISGEYCKYCMMRTVSHPVFTELRNRWYVIENNKSKKIIPHDLTLTWQTAAFWACDDGSNWKGRTFRLHTDCFSFQEVEFLLEKIKVDLGIMGSLSKKKGKPIIIFLGNNAFDFMEGIKPFVVNCYKYKTLNRCVFKFHTKKSTNNKTGIIGVQKSKNGFYEATGAGKILGKFLTKENAIKIRKTWEQAHE